MTEATLASPAGTTSPPAPPGTPQPARSHLDRSLVRGIAWTGASKWAGQTLRWASTLLIARLLTPSDYGLVGYATLYMGLVALINEFGLSAAIIQRRDLTDEQISYLGSVSLLLGVFFFLVTCVLAVPVSLFFEEPQVRWVMLALGTTFIIKGVQVLPRSLLTRDLRFRLLAWIDTGEAAVLAAVTLVLAFMGYRYWSLVWGSVISITMSTLVTVAVRPHRLSWPRNFDSVRSALTFGSHVAVSRVAWYAYSNADFAVVGRVLGKSALGNYTIGWTLANIPVERVSAIVGRVTMSIFSRVQNDLAALRRYLLVLTEGLAIITFPISIGMALVAREMVLVVLGKRWERAIVPLGLLVFYGGFRSITLMFSQVLLAIGHTKRNMQFNLLAAVVLPIMFYIGSRWGTAGVAMAWIIGFPIVYVPFFIRHTFRAIEMPASAYLRALWPAVSGTLAMAAAVLAIRYGVSDDALLEIAVPVRAAVRAISFGKVIIPPGTAALGVRLVLEVVAGAIAYVGVLLLAHRRRLQGFLTVLRRAAA